MQYERRDNIKIFGTDKAPREDPFKTVIQVASDGSVAISRDDISVCHRLPTRSGTKPITAKFVRREVKSAIMRGKEVVKEKN